MLHSYNLCLFTTSSSVQTASILAFIAIAPLELYQVEFAHNTSVTFPVEGVASVTIGGSPPRHFAFNCVSTSSDGTSISWSRADGTSLTMTQIAIANGVQLGFEDPVSSDLVVYACYNAATGEFVTINVTDGKEN